MTYAPGTQHAWAPLGAPERASRSVGRAALRSRAPRRTPARRSRWPGSPRRSSLGHRARLRRDGLGLASLHLAGEAHGLAVSADRAGTGCATRSRPSSLARPRPPARPATVRHRCAACSGSTTRGRGGSRCPTRASRSAGRWRASASYSPTSSTGRPMPEFLTGETAPPPGYPDDRGRAAGRRRHRGGGGCEPRRPRPVRGRPRHAGPGAAAHSAALRKLRRQRTSLVPRPQHHAAPLLCAGHRRAGLPQCDRRAGRGRVPRRRALRRL